MPGACGSLVASACSGTSSETSATNATHPADRATQLPAVSGPLAPGGQVRVVALRSRDHRAGADPARRARQHISRGKHRRAARALSARPGADRDGSPCEPRVDPRRPALRRVTVCFRHPARMARFDLAPVRSGIPFASSMTCSGHVRSRASSRSEAMPDTECVPGPRFSLSIGGRPRPGLCPRIAPTPPPAAFEHFHARTPSVISHRGARPVGNRKRPAGAARDNKVARCLGAM